MFQFDSIADFIYMGGHGYYVWFAYLITLLVLVALVVLPQRKQKQLCHQLLKHYQGETPPQHQNIDQDQGGTTESDII